MLDMIELFNTALAVLLTAAYAYQLFFLVYGLVNRRRQDKQMARTLNRYGVIICARNEAGVIGELIASLRQQKYTDDTVELDMGRQRLCVRGEGLALAELAGRNLFVKGQVFSIELKNNDGKGGGWRDAGMAAGQGAVSGGRRRR